VACGEFLCNKEFERFDILAIDDDERYAANCIWVNNQVIAPLGFPQSEAKLELAGFEVLTVDVSEFQKLDGGLSCLSLRF
jgi:dimethylargininase